MSKYETIPLTQQRQSADNDLESRLDLFKSLKYRFPFLRDEHLKYICGFLDWNLEDPSDIITFLLKNYKQLSEDDALIILKQATPKLKSFSEHRIIQTAVSGAIHETIDFTRPATTESDLFKISHYIQLEDAEAEKKRNLELQLLTKVQTFYQEFLTAPFKFSVDNIQEILNFITELLSLGLDSEEEIKKILENEKNLIAHLEFINLRVVFEELKNGNYSSESKATELVRAIGKYKHPRWENELGIIVGFLEYVKAARNLNYEMDKTLKKTEKFFQEETQTILNIPIELIKRIASVLKSFNELSSKTFSFFFNNPLNKPLGNLLSNYYQTIQTILLEDSQRNFEVNDENLERISKIHYLMELFAGFDGIPNYENIKSISLSFAEYLKDFKTKLFSIKLCERLLIEKAAVIKDDKNEQLVQAAIRNVFTSSELKERLLLQLSSTNPVLFDDLLNSKTKQEVLISIYSHINWKA
ncbi:MAG: hypothetical protein RBS56_05310 [Candidatus Gracilibacteria bacterium]|jgi:hypothetical protein|nr:hypothetical protein [Candidatus Gracilibacteria bacterium]